MLAFNLHRFFIAALRLSEKIAEIIVDQVNQLYINEKINNLHPINKNFINIAIF